MRYLLIGGIVISDIDDRADFISPIQLAILYGLPGKVPIHDISFLHDRGYGGEWLRDMDPNMVYILEPRPQGDYEAVARWLRELEEEKRS
jgi:hypothetical protein